MKILETERLILREITEADAAFILDLLNQPSFIKYIGDRNVRTIEAARDYIESRFIKSYRENSFGFYLVELKPEFSASESEIQNPKSKIKAPIGICGFVKRESLPEADLGFAFLGEFEGKGYGFESASAVLQYGKKSLDFNRLLAITTQNNQRSIKLLEKLGFKFERLIKMPHDAEKLKLFVIE